MSGTYLSEVDWLKQQAETIRRLTRQTVATIVRVGDILCEANRRLGKVRFYNWIETEFRWSRSSAHRMMQVGRTFGEVPVETLEKFGPSALYTLSRNCVPNQLRSTVLELAADGKRFSDTEVRELIAVARGDDGPPKRKRKPRQLMEEEAEDEQGGANRAPLPPALVMPGGDEYHATLAAKALIRLTEQGVTVRLSRMPDSQEDDPVARPWVCHLYQPDREPEAFVSKDGVLSALTLAAGVQPERTCSECQVTKPVFHGFSCKTGYPLDRSKVCRKCETARVGIQKKRLRGTLPRSKEEDEAKRARVRDHLTAHPDDTADTAIGEACGCSAQLVEKVRKEMGLPTLRDNERDAREAVRRELLADPNRSHPVIAELCGCHEDTARRIRLEMEEADEIPRATIRTGLDGVTANVLELASDEVCPVDDLVTELVEAGA